jgi:hypothetical protein
LRKQEPLYSIRTFLICFAAWCCGALGLSAQEQEIALPDTADRIVLADSVRMIAVTDSMLTATINASMNRERFIPDPIRSMWLALVFPGAGQIYNRKYWKLPIIYGGFLGCVYALTWNNQMLHDYSQAYLDIMDTDPNTKSYEKMLPIGYDITGREERFKTVFKNKKNFFRRNRDLSIFAFAGVYLLAVIDAYVDAELSTFDISDDLSLHLEPTVIQTQSGKTLGREAVPGIKFTLSY